MPRFFPDQLEKGQVLFLTAIGYEIIVAGYFAGEGGIPDAGQGIAAQRNAHMEAIPAQGQSAVGIIKGL